MQNSHTQSETLPYRVSSIARRTRQLKAAIARPTTSQDRRGRLQGNLYESVYETLRRAIVRGIVPTGQRLVVSSLALEMGVSRTPVRDALSRLETMGLVRRTGRSYGVVGLTATDVDDLTVVRSALEGMAAALAAARITEAEIERLRQLAGALDDASLRGATDKYRSLHRAFHAHVTACSRNVYLQRTLASLMDFIDLVWEATSPNRERLTRAQEQHKDIVRALARRDSARARRVLVDHVNSGMGLIREALEQKQSTTPDLRQVMAEVVR
jgi:DNA-binding GntR family transcriptional regulator